MKTIEPSNPCFLFIKPNIIPESKNKTIEIAWIKYWLILIPLEYWRYEIITELTKVKINKVMIANNVDIIIFFIVSPKVYIFKKSQKYYIGDK